MGVFISHPHACPLMMDTSAIHDLLHTFAFSPLLYGLSCSPSYRDGQNITCPVWSTGGKAENGRVDINAWEAGALGGGTWARRGTVPAYGSQIPELSAHWPGGGWSTWDTILATLTDQPRWDLEVDLGVEWSRRWWRWRDPRWWLLVLDLERIEKKENCVVQYDNCWSVQKLIT